MILESIKFEGSLEYICSWCCRTVWFAWLPPPSALDLGLWWIQTLCAFPSAFFFLRVSPALQPRLLPPEPLPSLLRWLEATLKPWACVSHRLTPNHAVSMSPNHVSMTPNHAVSMSPFAVSLDETSHRGVWHLVFWAAMKCLGDTPQKCRRVCSLWAKPWLRGNRK